MNALPEQNFFVQIIFLSSNSYIGKSYKHNNLWIIGGMPGGCPSGLFWQPPWSWLSSSCDLCLGLVCHRPAPPHDVPMFDASPMHIVPQPPNVSIMGSQPRHRHNLHGGTVGRSWHSINWGGFERRDNVWRWPSDGAGGNKPNDVTWVGWPGSGSAQPEPT